MSASVTWHGDKAAAALLKRAVGAVGDGGEFLLEASNRTAPIETAAMIGSGSVVVDKRRIVATVSYDTPYAIRQHEDTRLHHDSGRRAKWLERTFIEQSSRVLSFLADRMRRGH